MAQKSKPKAKKSTRSPALKAAQSAYERTAREERRHVQWNNRMKSAADLALIERLKARFPDLTLPAIAKLALRELDAKKNKR